MSIRFFALARSMAVVFLLIASVLVYLPWGIGVFRWAPARCWQLFGIAPLLFGACLGLYCAFAFAWSGLGTPAPFDPPRTLVVGGVYRYVRNPMYWGAFLVLVGQWTLFGVGWPAFIYVASFALLTHLFVRFYEEPTLRRKFGADYTKHCDNVPRWLPRFKPWTQSRERS